MYQNEVKCSAFDMEMTFYSHANNAHIHKKGRSTWPHFESEGFWNSEVGYQLILFFVSLLKTKRLGLKIMSNW